MKPSSNPENKTPSDTYLRVQLMCKKAQASQFFRTTTGILLGSDTFDKSDAENNTSRLLNRGGITDLPLLETLSAICQKS